MLRPKSLYRMISWAGHINFRSIHPSYQELDDGRIEILLTTRAEDDDLPEYFETAAFCFSILPQTIGYERAKVDFAMQERTAKYVITLPQKKKGIFLSGYFRRFFSSRKEFEASMHDYEASRDELYKSQHMLSVIMENSPDIVMLVSRNSTIN